MALEGKQSLKMWLDPEGQLYQSLVRFKCGPQPKQVAFTPDGKEMWVLLGGGVSGLEVFDPLTGKKMAAVKLGGRGATEVIFTNDGKTIYASQMDTATICEIDRATRKVMRPFKSGGNLTKILLLSPDEKTLYASNWVSNDVSEIDVATRQARAADQDGHDPARPVHRSRRQAPVRGRLRSGDIQRIDLATGKGTVLIKTGGSMRHMVADEKSGLLYVDDFDKDAVYVVDLATEEVTKLADTDQRPNTIDLSPDGRCSTSPTGARTIPRPTHPRPRMGLGARHRHRHRQDPRCHRRRQPVHRSGRLSRRHAPGLLRLPRLRHPRLPDPGLLHPAGRERRAGAPLI